MSWPQAVPFSPPFFSVVSWLGNNVLFITQETGWREIQISRAVKSLSTSTWLSSVLLQECKTLLVTCSTPTSIWAHTHLKWNSHRQSAQLTHKSYIYTSLKQTKHKSNTGTQLTDTLAYTDCLSHTYTLTHNSHTNMQTYTPPLTYARYFTHTPPRAHSWWGVVSTAPS